MTIPLLAAKRMIKARSRAMRTKAPREPNKAEQLFAFHCKAYGLPRPIEQFLFAKKLDRLFRADFAFLGYNLIVEIKGGIWRRGGGAHSHPTRLKDDLEREQYAALLGYCVMPFAPEQVTSGFAIDWTMRALEQRGWRRKL